MKKYRRKKSKQLNSWAGRKKKVEADSSRIHWSNQHQRALICTRCSLSQRRNTNAKAFCAMIRWTSIKSLAHKTKHFQSLSSIRIKQNRKSKICLWFFSIKKLFFSFFIVNNLSCKSFYRDYPWKTKKNSFRRTRKSCSLSSSLKV